MAKFITFFSYKGGAGRSTTCLNTLPFIAQELRATANNPVIVLDTDINSAGMTYLLGDSGDDFSEFDVKELFFGDGKWEYARSGGVNGIRQHSLYKYFKPVGNKLGLEDNASVLFLGVRVDGRFKEAILNSRDNIPFRMRKIRTFCTNFGVSAVVMDSAAGDQMTAELSVKDADSLVVCMRPSRQFREGTFSYLCRNAELFDEEVKIVLLPTVVPGDCEIDGQSMFDYVCDEMSRNLNGVKEKLDGREAVDCFIQKDFFGINEVRRFKWQENILYKLQADNTALAEDEKIAVKRYARLARVTTED